MNERLDFVIAGGGLSGCLAALALAEKRPDLSFLMVEGGTRFGGNHIWSFFDSDVAPEAQWLADLLPARRWADHEVRFPLRSRTIELGYNSLRSHDLDALLRQRLRPERYRLGARIAEVGEGHVRLESGERIEAAAVIDARGAEAVGGVALAWQKFVGHTYRCATPHGRTRPIIMDAQVEQTDGYRFVYTLPFSDTEILIEDTYYSTDSALDVGRLRARIGDYLEAAGWQPASLVGEETGVLPVALAGDAAAFWPSDEAPVARLGLRGGFFHPTTGYSLPDALANAALLTKQSDFTSVGLHALYRARSASLWRERRFYRMLNRMLFGAAPPEERYRVLQHFYRLPPATIGRFYAGRSTLLDKARVLSGRPPVPVRPALAAALGKAA
ncbi:MAG TPA: lycopene beta-cyclase CrtY [Allosphingosinicella sp.]